MRDVGKLLFVIGLGAFLLGGFDVTLLLRGTPSPERTTAEALGAVDGTTNVHLTVTDFKYGDTMVIEEDGSGNWNRVWLPLLTSDGEWTPRPVVVHVKAANPEELARLLSPQELTGVVSNGMIGLGKRQREQFADRYPSADLSGAIAIEVGRRFPSPYLTYPLTFGGLAALVVGIGLHFGFIGKQRFVPHDNGEA